MFIIITDAFVSQTYKNKKYNIHYCLNFLFDKRFKFLENIVETKNLIISQLVIIKVSIN